MASSDPQSKNQSILLAKIGAPQGIKGEVRVKPYGDPQMLDQYGKLHDANGNTYKITRMRPHKSMLMVKFMNVNTRNEAEALNGVELFIARDKLPNIEDEDEFYVEDLTGMSVMNAEGEQIGTVVAVPNFGAGDMLEIAPSTGSGGAASTWYLPFTRETVPAIDFENSCVIIEPPAEVSERDDEN